MTDPEIPAHRSLDVLLHAIARQLDAMSSPSPDIGLQLQHMRTAVHAAAARHDPAAAPGRNLSASLRAALDCGLHAEGGSIARTLTGYCDSLPWSYHYEPRAGECDLATRIAFAELIGPDGPMDAPDCRLGFTLMAADTYYPMHAHPAVELYLVISGDAEWQTPSARRMVPPGQFVLHRSNEPHAMRTFAQSLIALWGWSGDLDTPAAYVH